ncbi:bi-domain-containing oxidoreductase [Pelomonas sp. P7]|uniref:Bi-domain-containing oxidoreductase n=1 Tax=Pelomonas caseinilytica TaxID=2906763 RepID=A0ABS8XH41_9BURK|nr:bi-domain-containing oxidoreductase [Pelomonas sp. P7]
MKQVLQNLKTGATEVADIPCPAVKRGHLLIRTTRSLVSVGTERMLVDFGKAGWIEKARQQPDKVRMVLDKIRTDGLAPTLEAVRNKLDQPLPMGYCNIGEVVEVGAGVTGFEVGDRVASNGKHAEVVAVPANLCAKVPEGVADEEAAFTVISAIALQGIRLVQPTLGETVVVTGLGLIGLITVQLLRAHGCRVLGLDFDATKLALAREFGAEVVNLAQGQDPLEAAKSYSRGRGVDAVLITASTKSNEPVHQAALMCRKRGRIVLVGVTGLELSRADFFEKELTFQVSCSYGPGRYDSNYEEKGQDYPFGYVRWTEQRNFEAVLDMLSTRQLDVSRLVTHRFDVDMATAAYDVVGGAEQALGIVLKYPVQDADRALARTVVLPPAAMTTGAAAGAGSLDISFIGSGNYATAVLIPAFKSSGARLHAVASATGVSGLHAARKFGFAKTTTDTAAAIEDAQAAAIVITTRHDSHAALTLQALAAGKHVFVEKPLCLTLDELARIHATARDANRLLMVGFNRRFAPHVVRMKQLLLGVTVPKSFVMTVNAGAIPGEHWTQDPAVGGGRIIGEACHFIDLLRFLADAPITGWDRLDMDSSTGDTVTIQLRFADGSIGTVHYFANGSKAFPKERLEIFAAGRVLQLDNFRKLIGFGWPGFTKLSLWRQDKGQKACAKAFVDAVTQGGASPIPLEQLIEVSRVSIEIAAGGVCS